MNTSTLTEDRFQRMIEVLKVIDWADSQHQRFGDLFGFIAAKPKYAKQCGADELLPRLGRILTWTGRVMGANHHLLLTLGTDGTSQEEIEKRGKEAEQAMLTLKSALVVFQKKHDALTIRSMGIDLRSIFPSKRRAFVKDAIAQIRARRK